MLTNKFSAIIFLNIFLAGIFVGFTHFGAPIHQYGSPTPCPFIAIEGGCASGIANHMALSQHLLALLPLIILGVIFSIFLVAWRNAWRAIYSLIFTFYRFFIARENTSPSVDLLQRLFARGILNSKTY